MARETERPGTELYRGDHGPLDSPASREKVGRSRRGFLGGTGLAAIGAIVGGAMPFSQNSGISAAQAQGASAAPKGPQYLKFPGKNEGLVVLGDRPLVAETPESLLDDETTPIAKF